MASDLISRKAMLERLEKWNTSDCLDKAFYLFTMNRIIEQPTVDAVEVVRCEDCLNGKRLGGSERYVECMVLGKTMLNDDYCSWGVKPDGGDKE